MRFAPSVGVFALVAFGSGAYAGPANAASLSPPAVRHSQKVRRPAPFPISQVIIIVQENRTIDNLFNGFCSPTPALCANTVRVGTDSHGNSVALQVAPSGLETTWDPGHSHAAFLDACDASGVGGIRPCTNHGFDLEGCQASCPPDMAFYYVAEPYVEPYWNMVRFDGTLGDETFQSNEGPSFPSHLYTLASSSRINEDPSQENIAFSENPGKGNAGCIYSGTAGTINMLLSFPEPTNGTDSPGCIEQPTITDLLDAAHKSWRWYQNSATPTGDQALWSAPNNIYHICGPVAGPSGQICGSSEYLSHVSATGDSVAAIKSDIASGALQTVSWVIPLAVNSDHPKVTTNNGPNEVASIVNAVGESSYWSSTAIIVYWDDWGGWFDHIVPPGLTASDPYEYGFRVPLVVVSPFARRATVNHTVRDLSAVNYFLETIFNLGGPINPGYSIERDNTDNLTASMFNFSQAPFPFTAIPTPPPPGDQVRAKLRRRISAS